MGKIWDKGFEVDKRVEEFTVGNDFLIDMKLINYDCKASIIHAKMLRKIGVLSKTELKKIINALNEIINSNDLTIKINDEDCHTAIENYLIKKIGDAGKKIHTARSRNDQVVTDFKIWVKKASFDINDTLNLLIKSILKKAEKNIDTVMPGFTHLKNAQPISFAHYLLAYVEMLNRDKKRFFNNIELIDESPLGSAALAGTSYKIDRQFTAKKLGFKKPTGNSIDAVCDRDFAIDFLSAAATCAMHMSRLAEDFIIFNSEAFNFLKFSDRVLTGSSIMPQKKNPDPAELIRGKTAINYGKLNSMLTIMKGLPISYYKDLQDDKALVFDSYDTLKDTLLMANELILNLNANKINMKQMAQKGYTTATDFADYLVKKNNFPFREAYVASSKLVNYAEKKKVRLDELSLKEKYWTERGKHLIRENDKSRRITRQGKDGEYHSSSSIK